jgi:hypothetical protein
MPSIGSLKGKMIWNAANGCRFMLVESPRESGTRARLR